MHRHAVDRVGIQCGIEQIGVVVQEIRQSAAGFHNDSLLEFREIMEAPSHNSVKGQAIDVPACFVQQLFQILGGDISAAEDTGEFVALCGILTASPADLLKAF